MKDVLELKDHYWRINIIPHYLYNKHVFIFLGDIYMKWDFNDYFKSGYNKTRDDDFIEFLLAIKQMHANNKISEEQKIKKVKDYANKIYPKL